MQSTLRAGRDRLRDVWRPALLVCAFFIVFGAMTHEPVRDCVRPKQASAYKLGSTVATQLRAGRKRPQEERLRRW